MAGSWWRVTALAAPLMLGMLAAGCGRFYYNRPAATASDFSADHIACVRESSVPFGTPGYARVLPDLYSGCMRGRGWTRAKQYEPAPPNWFRGIEREEVVTIGVPPALREAR